MLPARPARCLKDSTGSRTPQYTIKAVFHTRPPQKLSFRYEEVAGLFLLDRDHKEVGRAAWDEKVEDIEKISGTVP